MKVNYENTQEDKDYYQAQLFEEKHNVKNFALENLKLRKGQLMGAKFTEGSKISDDGLPAITYSDIKQSVESMARMKADVK